MLNLPAADWPIGQAFLIQLPEQEEVLSEVFLGGALYTLLSDLWGTKHQLNGKMINSKYKSTVTVVQAL